MENRFVVVMVNDSLKEKKAVAADSEIIVNWKNFSIFVNAHNRFRSWQN